MRYALMRLVDVRLLMFSRASLAAISVLGHKIANTRTALRGMELYHQKNQRSS